MNLEPVSQKHLNELELHIRELLLLMRKANLHNEPIAKALYQFEVEVGQVRRDRFDAANPEYSGY
jgi:flagellar biosynthesis/type III secretory pathway chaperone